MAGHMPRVLGLVLVGMVLGCAGGSNDPPKCVPNQVVACGCANGRSGAQSCNADGTFGGCVCEAPAPQPCTVGAVLACACASGTTGTQTCAMDGTFGACSCPAPVECPPGFVRGPSGACGDVDECAAAAPPCSANATCINTAGAYVCSCRAGYVGDGQTCSANECANATHQCSPQARCVDTTEGYDCLCLPGYSGDGRACVNIDECAAGLTDCDPNADCQDTPGGFTCACPLGFTGDGRTCTDVDECAGGTVTCGANARCVNGPGTGGCACNPGYGGPATACTNVNECTQPVPPCGAVSCQDLPGSYRCVCPTGMVFGGGACVDEDECATPATCDANAVCTNYVMTAQQSNQALGHRCDCNTGFVGNGQWCVPATTTTVQVFTGPRPRLTISGVGVFDLGGLSRVGLDFDYAELPNGVGGTRKFPTTLHIPNITMRDLQGNTAAVTALANWANTTAPRDMTLEVRGIGPEAAAFNLVGARVVSHGSASGTAFTEVVLSVTSIAENSWEGTGANWPCPVPGWVLEVSGVAGYHPNSVTSCGVPATVPSPLFRHSGLVLPGRQDGPVTVAGVAVGRHMLAWFRENQLFAQQYGEALERDASIIRFDDVAMEYFRVNGYGMWPASITLFNPDRPYLSAPLVDVVLVCGYRWERA